MFPSNVQNATGSNPIDGEILAKIINGSLSRIGQDIGKLLLSVAKFQKGAETTTELPSTTLSSNKQTDDKNIYIIIGSSGAAGLVILIVIIGVVAVRYL